MRKASATDSTAWIGTRDLDNVGNFAGTSDEVAVWVGQKLTVSQAQDIYNATRTPDSLPLYADAVLDTGPIAYYRFNEPAGLTAGETVVNWANQGTTSTRSEPRVGTGQAADPAQVPPPRNQRTNGRSQAAQQAAGIQADRPVSPAMPMSRLAQRF